MIVHFVKTSHIHYTLECCRPDGSMTARTLESRSFLIHDLVHFALERDAGFEASFFGGVARGRDLGDDAPFSGELAVTEMIVGPVQSAVKSEANGDTVIAGVRAYATAQGARVPAVVTGELIDGVVAWVRATARRFDLLRTGERLSFTFDPPYQPIDCDFHDNLEAVSTLRKVVDLVVRDDDGSEVTLHDEIVDLGFLTGNAKAGEFVTLKSGKRYRFDRIVRIDGKDRPVRRPDLARLP